MSNQNTDKTSGFRPSTFSSYVGQDEVKEYLKIKVAAFGKTGVAPGHMLFLGPSGIGKTTLSLIVANELGLASGQEVGFHEIMATRVQNWDDLLRIFVQVKENDVVFIDEIHALPSRVQEELYGVMEDFQYDEYDAYFKRTTKKKLPRFTVIGATTHAGDLNAPLLGRFQYKPMLQPYSIHQLTSMARTAAKRNYGIDLNDDIAERMAQLSRRTARQCYSLLSNLMEFAEGMISGKVESYHLSMHMFDHLLKLMHLDPIVGTDTAQRRYLVTLLRERSAIGAKSIGAMINEQEATVVGMIEPFLFSDVEFESADGRTRFNGQLARPTKRGRIATEGSEIFVKMCQQLQAQGYFSNESLSY